jgi:hypothetical protein
MAQAYHEPIDSARSRERDGIIKDEEKRHIENCSLEYEDPFGNEEFAEVRYRTLYWWYERHQLIVPDEILTNNSDYIYRQCGMSMTSP